jgi:hypothetical protein
MRLSRSLCVYKYFGSQLLLVAGAYFIHYLGNFVLVCPGHDAVSGSKPDSHTPSPALLL